MARQSFEVMPTNPQGTHTSSSLLKNRLAAKEKDLLNIVTPVLEDLISVGYRLSPRLVERIRHLADEG